MKKITLLLAFAVGTVCAYAQDNFIKTFKRINENVQKESEAYNNLRNATQTIGHRLTGSANGAKAEAFSFNLLKSYGYQVTYQPFEVQSWDRISLSVGLGDSENGTFNPIKAVSLAHSPVSAKVTAQIVDVGNGTAADYAANNFNLKGKIALVYLGTLPGSAKGTQSLHRSEKTALATKNGAVGVIIINTVNNGVLLTGTASVTGKLIDVPAVCIGKEDGFALKQRLTQTPTFAKIDMANFSGLIKARNVVATLKGKKQPTEKIVVGGHLDSWDLATGAIDNGIGSFAIIDMARAFKQLKLNTNRTVEFVLFMGEEQGLLGSKAYIDNAKRTGVLANIKFMLNYDMNNDQKGYATSRKEMESQFKSWGNDVMKIDSGFKNMFAITASLHSDHQPFMLEGIPIGTGAGSKLPNNAGPYYHSDGDAFHLVNEQELKNTVRYSSMLIYALANTPKIPAAKFNEAEIKSFLEEKGLKEPLSIAGDWRW